MKNLLIFAFTICFFPIKAQALTLFFNGHAEQGGALFGYVSPDAKLTMNDTEITPRKDGWFLIGIGRDDTGFLTFKAENDEEILTKKLKIQPKKWNIQRVNGLPQNTVTPNKAEEERIKREAKITNKARENVPDMEMPLCFSRPAKGRISSVYGSQRILNGIKGGQHNAIDIANKIGTIITAPADGVVLLSYDEMLVSGKTLLLGHGQNLTTSYIHMDKLFVKKGQKVKKGEQLGTIGKTGRANGPHLHWTVMWNDKRIDPQTFLKNSAKFCARVSLKKQEGNEHDK